jgi:basic membrane protein A
MKLLAKTISAVAAGAMSMAAMAADFSPAVIYDQAGKNDKSFNEAVFRNGVEAIMAEQGVKVREFEPQNEAQMEQGLRRLAQRGHSPIIAIGFTFGTAVEKVAKEFPELQFAIIDMVVDLPNVQSIVFAEHQGSFLVGALAAMAAEDGDVGFVGGMDIPLIRKFACGYEQGAKYVNADIEVFQNMTGTTPSAWSDPAKGAELAKAQFTKGAEVVFAAAGGTGIGVYQAAKDEDKLAIGVDSNQNYMQPGTMLSSMVKRVGVAAYQSWMEAKDGTWEAGFKVMDLSNDGVDWALDEYNRDLVSAEMESQISMLKAKIQSGEIVVHDYMATNSCDY